MNCLGRDSGLGIMPGELNRHGVNPVTKKNLDGIACRLMQKTAFNVIQGFVEIFLKQYMLKFVHGKPATTRSLNSACPYQTHRPGKRTAQGSHNISQLQAEHFGDDFCRKCLTNDARVY